MSGSQTGIALLELLVAMVLFAIFMTSISQMHVRSIRDSFDSRQRAHALWLAQGFVDKIHANNTSQAIQGYVDNIDEYSSCSAVPQKKCEPTQAKHLAESCDVEELVQADIWSLFCDGDKSAVETLIDHDVTLSCVGGCGLGSDMTLLVSWMSRATDNDSLLREEMIEIRGVKLPANRDFIALNFRP